jgi:hypothetical protein
MPPGVNFGGFGWVSKGFGAYHCLCVLSKCGHNAENSHQKKQWNTFHMNFSQFSTNSFFELLIYPYNLNSAGFT